MAAIHEEFNTWKGAGKRSRAEVAQWLTDKGVEDHAKFKTAARQAKSRGSKTAEQKSAGNAQRRQARAESAVESVQPHLDASHHTLGQALQATNHPVKVEFTTDRANKGKWADRMVPAHSVPMFTQGSDSQNMVVTVFGDDGGARAYHLSRPKTTAPINTHGHSTGGRVITKVVDTGTKGPGRPPFSVTMNEGDAQTLRSHQQQLAKLEASEPASVDVPPEMRQMRETMQYLEGVHRENLNTVAMTDEQPQRSADRLVVPAKQLGRARRYMQRAHAQEMEENPGYAQRAGAYLDAEEARRKHSEAVRTQKGWVSNLERRGQEPRQVLEVGGDVEKLTETGVMDVKDRFSVQGAGRSSTQDEDPRIDADQMIDYVEQNADTPSMRQARTAMHLARSAGAGSGAEAAEHARRAETAAGVKWDEPPLQDVSVPKGSGLQMAPKGTVSLPDESGALARSAMEARIAGQMRQHPLYASAAGTGLGKSVKAMGGRTGPTSNVGKIAEEAQSLAVNQTSPRIGYPHKEYRRGIEASSRDPLPPYHGVEATDVRPDESGPIADIRNEVRAGLSTIIGHRNTRASRGR